MFMHSMFKYRTVTLKVGWGGVAPPWQILVPCSMYQATATYTQNNGLYIFDKNFNSKKC